MLIFITIMTIFLLMIVIPAVERDLDQKKINGLITDYYESGAIAVEYNFKSGKKHGKARGFYESGAICWEGIYNKNTLTELTTFKESKWLKYK